MGNIVKKLFVVDQSKLIPRHLADILGDSFEIRSCQYADTALLKIIAWHPDLLITGTEIGNLSGFDLCKILKMIPEFAGLPIIFLSGHNKKIVGDKAEAVGADIYIEKSSAAFLELKEKISELFVDSAPIKPNQQKVTSVILVDDSVLVRTMLNNMLKSNGITEIIQATNGQEALNILSERSVDLILSDYHMPVMDGPELVRNIRKLKAFDNIPIIIATGEQKESQIKEVRGDGANGVLIKPISGSDLKSLLSAYANGTINNFGCNINEA